MTAPAEIISRLKIKGFKSIRDLDIELDPFNVLVGANGTGKSNFVDFFRMLNYMFSATYGKLNNFVKSSGGTGSVLYYGPRATPKLEASIQLDAGSQWTCYETNLEWAAPDDLHFDEEVFKYTLNDGYPEPHVQTNAHGRWESTILDWANSEQATPLRAITRRFRDTLQALQIYHFHDTSAFAHVRGSQNLYGQDRLAGDASNLAVFLYYLKRDKPSYYKRILSTVQLVAPFVQDFLVEPQATNEGGVMLRWVDKSGDLFGPHQLSDGTTRALALVSALQQPEEMMPSIMLFDEPELGLHPSAVSLIASLLQGASERRQVIVATQSPILIREFSPASLIVVERRENRSGMGESTFRRLESGELDTWLEDFDLGELYEKNITGGYPR